jgi:antitoxin ParD1/3/4
MTQARKITGAMSAWVDEQINAGRFADENEAIQAGLVALADRDARISNLQGLVQQGVDDLEAGRYNDYDSPEALIQDIMRG